MNKHHIPARLLAMLVLAQAAVALPPEMAGYDPSKQIRFSTPAQAEARRQELIHFIWPDGLPSNTLPTVARNIAADVFDRYLPGIERKSVAAVDKLDADIAPYDFHSISYLLHPFKTNANTGKLVIYHSGHRRSVAEWAGGDDVINRLLTEGFTVLAMDMPCYGWNADDTIKLPEEKVTITREKHKNPHEEMFRKFLPKLPHEGAIFRFFLEPVVQGINCFLQTNPGAEVAMVGISGGGWATTLAPAVDIRITRSFPVAGTYPLYCRTKPFPAFSHDIEQFYDPLYREIDSDGDGITDTAAGVASWLEIYALGAFGPGRRQIQILNFNDTCCFFGDAFKTYHNFLPGVLRKLGQGEWSFHSDTTHARHWISRDVIDNSIMPGLTGVIMNEKHTDWNGQGRRLFAMSFLPSPTRSHATMCVPGLGFSGFPDLDGNGRADVLVSYGPWKTGLPQYLFIAESPEAQANASAKATAAEDRFQSAGFSRAPAGKLDLANVPAPLFRDPVFDGAADPSVLWNGTEQAWYIFYTQRRANQNLPGVSWYYGTKIGIAKSTDAGRTWNYIGTAEGLSRGLAAESFWAPHVFEDNGTFHLFVAFVPKIASDGFSGKGQILHYTGRDPVHWKFSDTVDVGWDDVIDPCLVKLRDGRWLMAFREDRPQARTAMVTSLDLQHWTRLEDVTGDRPHEAPVVLYWKDKFWLFIDEWRGIGVYQSDDGIRYTRNGLILDQPGKREDDHYLGSHPGVALVGDRALIFYHCHTGRTIGDASGQSVESLEYKRSSLQVAELELRDGIIVCDRDKHSRKE
ncbi:MAG: hypothetical protein WCK77_11875 [Verrucomicrobiota bacterium]